MANGKLELYGMTPIRALSMTTHNELIALTTISSFQGQNETAFPGLDKLSERSGISKQAFSKAVTGLVKKNLVNRKRRYGSSNIYFVVWEFADKAEIKKENDAERRMSRAKILAKNIQLSESIGYIKESDHDYPNDSDVSYPNGSDDILKEQYKRTEVKEEKLMLSLEEENKLSALNLKTTFINTLTANGINYNPGHKDTRFNYFILHENNMTPQELIDLIPKLIQVKKENPNDKFFSGICWNMSDLISYKAKINNAYKPKVVQFSKPETKQPVQLSEKDLTSMKEFLA